MAKRHRKWRINNDVDRFPLHVAARIGDLESSKRLVKCGLSVNSQDDNGSTPLNLAATNGHLQVVDFLCSLPACNLNLMDRLKHTPLVNAACQEKKEVVDLLIQRGADVNLGPDGNWTLFHHASLNNWADVVRYILNNGGVNLNAANMYGSGVLGLVMKLNNVNMATLLISEAKINYNERNGNALHWAASLGHLDMVERLLVIGNLDLNQPDCNGETPLHRAVKCRHYNIVQLLCSRPGCDLNVKECIFGHTPLTGAANQKDRDITKLLVSCGAHPGNVTHCGWSVLHYAAAQGWVAVVLSVLERGGAHIDGASKYGQTPLIVATAWSKEEAALLLVRSGADVLRSDSMGHTARHFATMNGLTRVVLELLGKEGVQLDAQDKEGETPLHYACSTGHLELVKLLLERGADTAIKNGDGDTAFGEGIQEGMLGMDEIRLFMHKGVFLGDRELAYLSQDPLLKELVLKELENWAPTVAKKIKVES